MFLSRKTHAFDKESKNQSGFDTALHLNAHKVNVGHTHQRKMLRPKLQEQCQIFI